METKICSQAAGIQELEEILVSFSATGVLESAAPKCWLLSSNPAGLVEFGVQPVAALMCTNCENKSPPLAFIAASRAFE